ncbi:MAG: putative lipid II flippase FtsW [Candidatus Aceula lacicola]|nr:putative lipid II flippase FtsW [Candidatus Aceula lacicola]
MRDLRISIAIIVTVLLSVGVIMIFSSSGIYALQELGSSTYFLQRHLVYLCVGFILMALVMAMDYRLLSQYSKPILILSIVTLVLVLIPGIGKEVYGARRWFRFLGFGFQPSEFVKLAVVIYMADFLARKQNRIKSFFFGFIPVLCVLGVVSLLILKQPDLGTTVLIAIVVFIMLFIAGTRIGYLASIVFLSLPAAYYLIALVPYRLRRIQAFLDPWSDKQGAGFQLVQSQIALGSGGIFGIGLGKSMQKLFYLPAAHTDFILSIIGEELGLLGTTAIVFLFALFVWQGARIAKRTEDPFGYFLAIGIVAMIGLQAIVNIGVSIGAFPTKGLPLPFISYGGSALIMQMVCVGILLNISRIQDLL